MKVLSPFGQGVKPEAPASAAGSRSSTQWTKRAAEKPGPDRVQLSHEATALASALAQLANTESTDGVASRERLDALRAAIVAGTYPMDPAELAEAILAEELGTAAGEGGADD